MTHTNHRQGTLENLSNDYVVLAMAARGINDKGAGEKLAKLLTLALPHNPVNMGNMKVGNRFMAGSYERIIETLEGATIVQIVFTTPEDTAGFLRDVAAADLGISVVVTGIFEKTKECIHAAGLKRHTIEYSLGVWGKTELLPDPKVLEFTTMCGHGMIAADLVYRLAKDVQTGALTLDQATEQLVKPCVCGIANPVRAKELLAAFVAQAIKPRVRNLIAMDPSKCDKCYACEEACLEVHPDYGRAVCFVDATMGPAVSLRCFHCENAPCLKVCPTGNIYRDDETGLVLMKGTRCIGCKMCVMACPFGMIVWNDTRGTTAKCDLCIELRRQGKQPACVTACPRGALTVPDQQGIFQSRRQLAIQTVLAGWDVEAEEKVTDYSRL